MGAYSDALAIFADIKDDAAAVAAYLARYQALREELYPVGSSVTGGLRITSATVNGQSYAGELSVSAKHEWNVLKCLVPMLRAQAAISATTTPVFPDGTS